MQSRTVPKGMIWPHKGRMKGGMQDATLSGGSVVFKKIEAAENVVVSPAQTKKQKSACC